MVSYRIHECAFPDRHYRDRSTDGSEYRAAYGPSDQVRSAPRESIADCRAMMWALANYGRREMDEDIVEAAQANDKWFLIGNGPETNVIPNQAELQRMVTLVGHHLQARM